MVQVIKQSLGEYKKVINDGFNTSETCFDFSKTYSRPKTGPITDKTMEKVHEEK